MKNLIKYLNMTSIGNNLLKEDLWSVHEFLNELNIPIVDNDDRKYSIVGRIKILQKNHFIILSEVESIYLNKIQSILDICEEEYPSSEKIQDIINELKKNHEKNSKN